MTISDAGESVAFTALAVLRLVQTQSHCTQCPDASDRDNYMRKQKRAHLRGGVGGGLGEERPVLGLGARRSRQAQREQRGEDVSRAVGKTAVLGDLETVELGLQELLLEAVAHAAQERL